MDRNHASQLRQKLRDLRSQRDRIEEQLLEARELVRGSLLLRYHLAGGKIRGNAAHYVCVRRKDRRNQFIYVRKADLDRVRDYVEAYRRYRRGLSRLRILSREIVRGLDTLSEHLEVPVQP